MSGAEKNNLGSSIYMKSAPDSAKMQAENGAQNSKVSGLAADKEINQDK